ncbi:MAG: hypothetical protein ABJM12_00990, partial [Ekhidna sp.]
MKRKYLLGAFFIIVGIVGFAGVQYLPSANDMDVVETLEAVPTRRDMRRSFYEKREILVVYGATDPKLKQRYKDLLHDLSLRERTPSRRSAKITYKSADELTDEDVNDYIVYLVGAIGEHAMLKRFITDTPFQVATKQITMGGKKVRNEHTVLGVSFYPSPVNPKIPFSFLTGTNAHQVYSIFADKVAEEGQSFYRQNLDYELYSDKERVVMGDFNSA